MELTIVMPCLNEAETLEACIKKANEALASSRIAGEVVIADNGSTDGSQAIAERLGARVVPIPSKGYGNALKGGIAAARGQYVIMGDSDDSYDFREAPRILEKLREGYDLVMGNRFRGGIKPGAMPPLHRYLGNPVLTGIGKLFFGSPMGDFHCGLRGFRKSAYESWGLTTSGMEFATEMVVKATLRGGKIAEVPVTLWKDGRSRPPHLRSWRDGWRHLVFMLVHSPKWAFFMPGLALVVAGLAVVLALLPGPVFIGSMGFDIHTMLYGATAVICGVAALSLAVVARLYATRIGLLGENPRLSAWLGRLSLNRSVVLGVVLIAAGLAGSVLGVVQWGGQSFGPLDPRETLRIVIPSVLGIIVGAQVILTAFFVGLLSLDAK